MINDDCPRTVDAMPHVMRVSYPIVIGMASNTVMQFVDHAMVSRVGGDELAAIGPGGSLAFSLLILIMATAQCTSAFVSQTLGAGRPHDCPTYAWQGLYFALPAQLLTIPFIIAAPRIFASIGHEGALPGLEAQYFAIRLCHAAGTASYAALSSFFVGIGRQRVAMKAAIAANIFNVLANYVLIFGHLGLPAMGLAGAALGTTLSSYLQVGLLMAVFLSRPYDREFSTRTTWRYDDECFRRLLRVGVPAGLNSALNIGSWAVFTTWIIGGLGQAALAAHNAVSQIWHLSFLPMVGVSHGVTAIVGQEIGAGHIDGAKRHAYAGVFLALGYMCAMGLLLFALRRPLVTFFSKDPEVIEIGMSLMLVGAFLQAFDALGIVSQGALRGAGDTRFPALVSIACGWLFFLPLAVLVTGRMGLGALGGWLAFAVNICIVGAVLFGRFRAGGWADIRLVDHSRRDAEEPPRPL